MLFSISQAVYLHGCACTPTIFACSQCRLESHSLFKKVRRARYLILLVGQVYKILWLDLLTSNWFIRFLFSFLLFSVYVFIFFQLFLCIWPSFCVSILYTRFHGSVWYSRFLFFSYFFFTVIYIFCIYDEVSDCDFSENYLAIFWYQLFIMHLAGYIYIYSFWCSPVLTHWRKKPFGRCRLSDSMPSCTCIAHWNERANGYRYIVHLNRLWLCRKLNENENWMNIEKIKNDFRRKVLFVFCSLRMLMFDTLSCLKCCI